MLSRPDGNRIRGFGGLGRSLKRVTLLLAAPAAVLFGQGEAKAVLTYNIFESGGNFVVQASGSLDLTGISPYSILDCSSGIVSTMGMICIGSPQPVYVYLLENADVFEGSLNLFDPSSVSGVTTSLVGALGGFGLDPAYDFGTPIVSSATFDANGQTLADFGITTVGLIGTWTIGGTSESIQVFVGPPTAAAVPGPLPLLGAGAAFGWSRRLRKRIATPLSTKTQA